MLLMDVQNRAFSPFSPFSPSFSSSYTVQLYLGDRWPDRGRLVPSNAKDTNLADPWRVHPFIPISPQQTSQLFALI